MNTAPMQSTLHANDEGGMLASAKEYMAQTSGWEAVFASCLRYSTSEMADFNFIVAIEPSDLCDIDATLANLVLNDVHAATRIFEQAVYDEIVAKQLLTSCEELSQVSVTLRILNLPPLPLYTLKSAKDLHKTVATNRCFSFDGIVIAVSVAHKQLKSTRYRCPAFDCTSHKKRPIRVDGRSPSQSLRCCTHCGCILVEDISSRILQDELCIELVEQGSLDGRVMLRQSISAVVFGSEHVLIGESVMLIGWSTTTNTQEAVMEVSSVTRNGSIPLITPSSVPRSIRNLHKLQERGFFTSLASAFADDVIPPGSFLLVKCVLLLGLVQNQQPSDSALVDFLLVGEETLLIERLMIHAASFAERSITHRSLNALAFSSLKDKCYAGSLLLAHNGVCVIPELDSMKKSAKDQLLQILDTGDVHVDFPLQRQLKKQCSVWAHAQSLAVEDIDLSATQSSFVAEKKGRSKSTAFVDVFGLIVPCDDADDLALANDTLQRAMGVSRTSLISHEDFSQFIRFARSLKVTLTPEAESVVKGYYVGSRRTRPSVGGRATLPSNAIRTLMCLAECHAKINLRLEATQDDAFYAIFLYELCTSARMGSSLFNLEPFQGCIQALHGPQADGKMEMFQLNLRRFLAEYAEE